MEIKANYVATGLFTLAVIVGAFGFIYWFRNGSSAARQTTYRVVFDGSVSGLRTAAPVLFNGIRVGEVAALTLDSRDPRKVVAVISIDRAVPVRTDTTAGLAFQGLTGLAEISLAGGAADAAPLVATDGEPPTLHAEAGTDPMQEARAVLARVDNLIASNETELHASLQNIQAITAALAANSARVDKVMAGLEKLTGDGETNGQIGQAADSVRKLADDLDRNSADITAGLSQFSNSGLKEFQAFAVDGRHTLAELNKAIRNIDQHPTRLIFGR